MHRMIVLVCGLFGFFLLASFFTVEPQPAQAAQGDGDVCAAQSDCINQAYDGYNACMDLREWLYDQCIEYSGDYEYCNEYIMEPGFAACESAKDAAVDACKAAFPCVPPEPTPADPDPDYYA